ncbi:tyrosine-type recombinase/integrase [Micromonospora sp. NBC_00858]|uniref:tyrosine-type recombinase/integrase n=1 Tax=Micromonospora sp. NBC_00858 TaxID=2975979 RepID=UPI00386B270F|nr:tyrosine-type recombinase/integrase [Micromonospora sp. NBC_00858]
MTIKTTTAASPGPDPKSGAELTGIQQVVAWAAGLPGLPADDGRFSIRRLTVAWNLEAWARSRHTAISYRRDLTTYLNWCVRERLDPLTARPSDLTQFRVWRELHGHTDRAAKPATVARALSSLSSWYRHLVANTDGTVARNPTASVKRPQLPQAATTAGLTPDEVDQLLAQADTQCAARTAVAAAHPSPSHRARHLAALRDRALLRLLADLGLRIGEALDCQVIDLRHNAGHRTLRTVAKGRDQRERALPAHTTEALDAYLAVRAAGAGNLTGPLFATSGVDGRPGRLAEPNVFLMIRRLAAAAGIPSAARLSPHSLRHAFATTAREAGVPLEDVQDAMGHADPRTTRRYDRDRHKLDRDPAHKLAARRASRRTSTDTPH